MVKKKVAKKSERKEQKRSLEYLKRIFKKRIFKGTHETLRTLLIFLATIQATAGVGLISIVTVFLGNSDTSVSLSESYAVVPLILHGLAIAGEVGLVLRMDYWWKRKDEKEDKLIEDWRIDGALLIALSAFGGLVWFLVETLW